MEKTQSISKTKTWLEDIVIGYGLCPFASKVYLNNEVGFTSISYSEKLLLTKMNEAIDNIKSPDTKTSTQLIIIEEGLENFDDYLNVFYGLEEGLKDSGLNEDFQLASFHPNYLFTDSTETSPENYSNRSPYPIIHILKVADVTAAIESHPDIHSVAPTNIAKLKSMGLATLIKTWQEKGFS